MKVFQLNYSDINGGAARAAYRIHHALRVHGIESQMLVTVASGGDRTVQGLRGRWSRMVSRLRPHLASPVRQLLHTGNPIIHSPAVVPSTWPQRLNASDADVVHLHWVQSEMLSVEDIGRIRKPIVWTLHDMWALCGAEHYTEDERWRDGYWRTNRPVYESGFDLNRWVWRRKCRHWNRPIAIACPSKWLADCARSSFLMRDWPVRVVPNPIDTDNWRPINKSLARKLLGLPSEVPLLVFGAMEGGRDPRKGFDLLLAALDHLKNYLSLHTMQLVVFGQDAPRQQPKLGYPTHYTGHLHDAHSLRALYSAADLLVLPSRQDNLPNTGLEAHSCGTPLVAFNIGGLSEIVDDRITGALAKPFEPASLAEAIRWVLEDPQRRSKLSAAARQRAEHLWSTSRVARLYSELYESILE